MERYRPLIIAGGLAVVITVFSAAIGVNLERWRDDAGVEHKGRRISAARSWAMLVCVCFGSSLGAGFLILGGAWVALGAVLILGGLVSGIVIAKTGPELPAPPDDGRRYEGLARFWHCTLPRQMLDNGRIVAFAAVAPPGAVVLLAFGKWQFALVWGALGAFAWFALLRVRSESVPRRGPCAEPE